MRRVAVRIPKLSGWQWGILVVGVVAAAAGAYFLFRAVSLSEIIAQVGALGPLPFFFALAILPVFGAPAAPFYLLAGATFGTRVAIPLVLAGVAANVTLSYVMARWVLRPFIVRLVKRLGYEIPVIRPEDRWSITLLVRITPGPPFFVQSYVLGLAGVPFGIYIVVSLAVASIFAVAAILFGESLMRGRSGLILLAVSLLVAAVVALRVVRNIMQRRRAASAAHAPPVMRG